MFDSPRIPKHCTKDQRLHCTAFHWARFGVVLGLSEMKDFIRFSGHESKFMVGGDWNIGLIWDNDG